MYRVPDSPPPRFLSDPESDGEGGAESRSQAAQSQPPRQLPAGAGGEREGRGQRVGSGSDSAGSDAESIDSIPSVFLSSEARAWEEDRSAGLPLAERLARDVRRRTARESQFIQGISSGGSERSETASSSREGERPSLMLGAPLTGDSQNSFPTSIHSDAADSVGLAPSVDTGGLERVVEGIVQGPSTVAPIPVISVEDEGEVETVELPSMESVAGDGPMTSIPPGPGDGPLTSDPRMTTFGGTPLTGVTDDSEENQLQDHGHAADGPQTSIPAEAPSASQQATISADADLNTADSTITTSSVSTVQPLLGAAPEQGQDIVEATSKPAESESIPISRDEVEGQHASASRREPVVLRPAPPPTQGTKLQSLRSEAVLGSGHRRTQSTTLAEQHSQPTRIRDRPRSESDTRFRDDATAAAERRSKLWGERVPLRVVPAPFRSKQPLLLSEGRSEDSSNEAAEEEEEEEEEIVSSEEAANSDSSDDLWEAEDQAVGALDTQDRSRGEEESSSSNEHHTQRRELSHKETMKTLEADIPRAPPPLALGRSRGGAAYSSSSDSSSADDVSSGSGSSLQDARDTSSRSDPPPAEIQEMFEKIQQIHDARLSPLVPAPAPSVPHTRLRLPSLDEASRTTAPLGIDKGKSRAEDAAKRLNTHVADAGRAGHFESDSASSCDFTSDSEDEKRAKRKNRQSDAQPYRSGSMSNRQAVSTRLQGLFGHTDEHTSEGVPLGPSALALARASMNARADFLGRTKWHQRTENEPASPLPRLTGPWDKPDASAATTPHDEGSARNTIFQDIAAARVHEAAYYSPSSAQSRADDTLRSLERLLETVSGSTMKPSSAQQSGTAESSSSQFSSLQPPKSPAADAGLSRSNAAVARKGRASYINNRASLAPPPREGRLPTITAATRHFPPSQPTPSWLAYIPAEERRALQEPIQPITAHSQGEGSSSNANRVSWMISKWEDKTGDGVVQNSTEARSRPSSWRPPVPPRLRESNGGADASVPSPSFSPEYGSPAPGRGGLPSPRTEALQRLEGGGQGFVPTTPYSEANFSPGYLRPTFAGSSSTVDRIFDSYHSNRQSMNSAISGNSASPNTATQMQIPSDLPSADLRAVEAMVGAGRAANEARAVHGHINGIGLSENFDPEVLSRATLFAVPDSATTPITSDEAPSLPTDLSRQATNASGFGDIGRSMITWQRSLRLRSTSDATQNAASPHEQQVAPSESQGRHRFERRQLPPVPGQVTASPFRRRPLPQPPRPAGPFHPSHVPPASGTTALQPSILTSVSADDALVSEPGLMRNDSHRTDTSRDRGEQEQSTTVEPRGNGSDSVQAIRSVRREASLGITDLDVLASRLEHEGDHYEAITALGEFLGPAVETRATAEEINELPVAKVELVSRRVTKTGKIKQKLEVAGVRVDRCLICLTQFRPEQMACIFPCLHM